MQYALSIFGMEFGLVPSGKLMVACGAGVGLTCSSLWTAMGVYCKQQSLCVSPPRLRPLAYSFVPHHHLSAASTLQLAQIKCLRENGTFLEFSLCSSRACLGKMLIFIYKWLKKCRFQGV
jgi:hypothetical protein